MREEEAEELFELVMYGTPITITYDRIKIDVDKKGQASIGIYPDIYGYKSITLADVNGKLAEYGFNGFVSEEFLLPILKEELGKQVEFAKLQDLKVNDTLLSKGAILIGNEVYLPVWAVAVACRSSFIWDEENQLIWKDNIAYHGLIKGDVIYSKMEAVQKLFNLKQVYREKEDLESLRVTWPQISIKLNSLLP